MKEYRTRCGVSRVLALTLMLMCMVSVMCVPALAASTIQNYIDGECKWSEVDDSAIIDWAVTEDGHSYLIGLPKSMRYNLTGGAHTGEAGDSTGTGSRGVDFYEITCTHGTVTITATGFSQLKSNCKTWADGEKAKESVSQVADGFTLNPDITGATDALQGLMDPLSLIVGVICVVVMVAITFFTATDLLYITIPVFREKSDAAVQSQNGNGYAASQSKKTGEARPRWITDEAYYSVRKSMQANDGSNPLTTYLLKRVWAFIVLGIVMYIMFTGNITLIVNIIINIISTIMGGLEGLAG